jgi:hypothetical protein
MRTLSELYGQLPGSEIVLPGIDDLHAHRVSANALLVLIASPNLSRHGIAVPTLPGINLPYEHRLYDLLCSEYGISAYSQYNTLTRRLVSFERALALLHRIQA